MLSDILEGPFGPTLDLGPLFPPPLFAYVTLAGFQDVGEETLRAFLSEAGHHVRAVHRVEQVHSATVVEAREAPCPADAVWGCAPGEAVRVVTADCVPVLLASSDGSRYAAVHAGWKGTLSRIVQRAVRCLAPDSPRDLTAYVGPAIGACCYQVSRERHDLFAAEFPGWVADAPSRPVLDLQSLNARQLEEAGVALSSIHVEERCTACSVGLCCSYRRDGAQAGRMAAMIGRTKAAPIVPPGSPPGG